MSDSSHFISQLNLEELEFSSLPGHETEDLSTFTDSSFFDFDKFPSQDLKLSYQHEFEQQVKLEEGHMLSEYSQEDARSIDIDVFLRQNGVEREQGSDDTFKVPPTPSADATPHSHSEMDKKKRNTAASARFRIKKKIKEQEMQRTLRTLSEKVELYNSKIMRLEMENKCLKSLIIEKSEKKSNELLRSIKERSIERS